MDHSMAGWTANKTENANFTSTLQAWHIRLNYRKILKRKLMLNAKQC